MSTPSIHRAVRRARPGIVPTVAALAFIALTVSLGNWQLRRAGEKAALAADYDSRASDAAVTLPAAGEASPVLDDIRFRHVRLDGQFDGTHTLYIDNRLHKGMPGYHIITPLRTTGGRVVLVNRGWVAAGPSRTALPPVPTPAGRQAVEGLAVLPPEKVFELNKTPVTGAVRLHVQPRELAAEWKLPLEPFVIEQTSPAVDGLVRSWERPGTGIDRHRAYALQWYSFAALAAFLYVFLGFRRNSRA
jgi:surfeit locus 1 family protein